MPRGAKKAYETLTARMPQALVDAARRYASQHGTTVADLLREGLEMRLAVRPEVRPEGRPEGIPHTLEALLAALEARMQAWLETAMRGQTTGRPTPVRGQTTVRPAPTATYLGNPCKRGHADAAGQCRRYTSTRACVECTREAKLRG